MMLIHNEEYEGLIADRNLLFALRAAGVDNWEGYDDAVSCLEDEEEDFLSGATCNPNAPEECESCQ